MIAAALFLSVLAASGAAVVIVYRRQRSEDAKVAKTVDDSAELRSLRLELADLVQKHAALRDEYDKTKILIPRGHVK